MQVPDTSVPAELEVLLCQRDRYYIIWKKEPYQLGKTRRYKWRLNQNNMQPLEVCKYTDG